MSLEVPSIWERYDRIVDLAGEEVGRRDMGGTRTMNKKMEKEKRVVRKRRKTRRTRKTRRMKRKSFISLMTTLLVS